MISKFFYQHNGSCLPMVQETRFNSWLSHNKKTWKMVRDAFLTLSIIRCRSRVSGVIQGKEQHLSVWLGVVIIEKGAFGSTLTMFGQLICITERERERERDVFQSTDWILLNLVKELFSYFHFYELRISNSFVHLAGAVKYTDCFFAEE